MVLTKKKKKLKSSIILVYEDMAEKQKSHLILQVVTQVDILRRFGVVQQLSVAWIHQVDTKLHCPLHWTLRYKVWPVAFLWDKKQCLYNVNIGYITNSASICSPVKCKGII